MTRGYAQDINLPGHGDSSQVLVQLTVPLHRSGPDSSKARAAEQMASQRWGSKFFPGPADLVRSEHALRLFAAACA